MEVGCFEHGDEPQIHELKNFCTSCVTVAAQEGQGFTELV
jgi:hypothetical protein